MDIYRDGPKLWDLNKDMAIIADTAIILSEQSEQEAVLVRARRSLELDLSFKCSCECIAYLDLVASGNYHNIAIKKSDLEKGCKMFKNKCRLHTHDALQYVNEYRVKQGLVPIATTGITYDEDMDCTYVMEQCVISDGFEHGCDSCLVNVSRIRPSNSSQFCPLDLRCSTKATSSTTDDDDENCLKNICHTTSIKCSDTTNNDVSKLDYLRLPTLGYCVIQAFHGLALNLPCIECRPHATCMARHWMRSLARPPSQTKEEDNDRSGRRRQTKRNAFRILSESIITEQFWLRKDTPFAPVIATLQPELESLTDSVLHANNEDRADISITEVAYSAGARVYPLLSHVVRIKNAVNSIKIETKHPAGGSNPNYHWMQVLEKSRKYGTLGTPEAFWSIIIQFCLQLPNAKFGPINNVSSSHHLEHMRRKWLSKLSQHRHEFKNNYFAEAFMSEADDDVTWRIEESAPAIRAGFMKLLWCATCLFANSKTSYESLVGYFWPIPREVAAYPNKCAIWLIERHWHWYCEATSGKPIDLIERTYSRMMTKVEVNSVPIYTRTLSSWEKILKNYDGSAASKCGTLFSLGTLNPNDYKNDFDRCFVQYLLDTLNVMYM